ncbi:glutamyl aminopeptidase-like [Anopheles cruzii]|uniref:glutamyl aminopeptidase-like n=1 Tax=Anopheles cruzii TaxID=68878 RepID=UPI0022EC5C6C|nr:glutamyl aminopeptidase-like [Anopheles cruzii]
MKLQSVSLCAIWLVLLATAAPPTVESRSAGRARAFDTFRLPNSTVPTHYSLYLDTDLHVGIFEYSGNVQIRINVLEATDQIVLHSMRSVITQLILRNSANLALPVKDVDYDVEKEFLVITTSSVLAPNSGSYTLDIDFNNSIDRNDQSGFYRSSYEDDQGVTRYLGLTQFESVDARTSFPCYDEPGIKTTYSIRIATGTNYHVRSNAPMLGIQLLPDGKKLTTFATTPRMQTYLVAWLVSDFVYEREILKEPQLAIATWAKPASSHLLTYSVDASMKFIRAMEEYFGEHYNMNKLDNVAIKDSDYAAGAMENWGLVTYRETSIYFDPDTQGESQQVGVVTIIGHEFTHQFFGNLLAPKWWSYLWLNEGFARLYQYYVGSISHPELNLRERFVTGPLQRAYTQDALLNVRPMTYYTETRAGISNLFDRIAYDKSASVLRMFSYAFGELTFQKGLRYYVQQNKLNGVVEESNLFAALEQAVKEDAVLPLSMSMHDIFRSWSNQAGVPEVEVRRDGDEFYFTQKRYYAEPQEDPSQSSWWIPISFTTPSNTQYETRVAFWMPPDVSEVAYTIPLAAGEIVEFNSQATGYYRLNYEPTLLNQLIERLQEDHRSIEPAARARLIDDTLHIAYRTGENYEAVFELLTYLRQEADYAPWMVAYENFKELQTLLRHDETASSLMQTFIAQLATPLLERFGVSRRMRESSFDEELRVIAIEMACSASESCKDIAHAARRQSDSYHDPAEVALQCVTLRQLSIDDRQSFVAQLMHALSTEQDSFSRKYIEEVLSCSGKDNAVVLDTLMRRLPMLSETDRATELRRLMLYSDVSAEELIQLIKDGLSSRKLNTSPSMLAMILQDLARYITDSSEAKLLLSVTSQYTPFMASEIEQQLAANRRWIERNVEPLKTVLSQRVTI